MSTTIDGIVSGLDTTKIIDAIIAAQAVPKDLLEQKVEDDGDRLDKLSGVKNRLSTLSGLLSAFNSDSEFGIRTATAADGNTQFSTSISTAAAAGTWSVQVTSLAKVETDASQGFADKSSDGVLNVGTYTVNVGGTSYNFTTDAGTSSMEDWVSKFNSSVTGAKASILNVGGANPYKIVLTGTDTGASKSISVTESVGTGGVTPTWTTTQPASDAQISVNGVSISSASNTVSDAIAGVTFTLKATGASATTLTIGQDNAAIAAKMKAIVTAYNDVMTYYSTNTVYNKEEDLIGALFGESSSRRVISGIGDFISDSYSVGGAFSALSQIGVSTNRDGTLTFDEDEFKEKLDSNYSDVSKLFTSSSGPIQALQKQIDDYYIDSDTGVLTSAADSLEESIKDNEERIEKMQERLDTYEAMLRTQFTALEKTLASIRSSQDALTSAFAGLTSSSS